MPENAAVVETGLRLKLVDLPQTESDLNGFLAKYGQSAQSAFGGVTAASLASNKRVLDDTQSTHQRIGQSHRKTTQEMVGDSMLADKKIAETTAHRVAEEARLGKMTTKAVGDEYGRRIKLTDDLTATLRHTHEKGQRDRIKLLLDEEREDKTIVNRIYKAREEVAHRGAGAEYGIMGTGRGLISSLIPLGGGMPNFLGGGGRIGDEFLRIAERAKDISRNSELAETKLGHIATVVGPIATTTAAVTALAIATFELAKGGAQETEILSKRRAAYREAGASVSQLANEERKAEEQANKFLIDWNVDTDRTRKLQTDIAFKGRVLGQTAQDIAKVSLAIEEMSKRTGDELKAEDIARIFETSDQESEAYVGRLRMRYRDLADHITALGGSTREALEFTKEYLRGTFDELTRLANDPEKAMERGDALMKEMARDTKLAAYEGFAPLFDILSKGSKFMLVHADTIKKIISGTVETVLWMTHLKQAILGVQMTQAVFTKLQGDATPKVHALNVELAKQQAILDGLAPGTSEFNARVDALATKMDKARGTTDGEAISYLELHRRMTEVANIIPRFHPILGQLATDETTAADAVLKLAGAMGKSIEAGATHAKDIADLKGLQIEGLTKQLENAGLDPATRKKLEDERSFLQGQLRYLALHVKEVQDLHTKTFAEYNAIVNPEDPKKPKTSALDIYGNTELMRAQMRDQQENYKQVLEARVKDEKSTYDRVIAGHELNALRETNLAEETTSDKRELSKKAYESKKFYLGLELDEAKDVYGEESKEYEELQRKLEQLDHERNVTVRRDTEQDHTRQLTLTRQLEDKRASLIKDKIDRETKQEELRHKRAEDATAKLETDEEKKADAELEKLTHEESLAKIQQDAEDERTKAGKEYLTDVLHPITSEIEKQIGQYTKLGSVASQIFGSISSKLLNTLSGKAAEGLSDILFGKSVGEDDKKKTTIAPTAAGQQQALSLVSLLNELGVPGFSDSPPLKNSGAPRVGDKYLVLGDGDDQLINLGVTPKGGGSFVNTRGGIDTLKGIDTPASSTQVVKATPDTPQIGDGAPRKVEHTIKMVPPDVHGDAPYTSFQPPTITQAEASRRNREQDKNYGGLQGAGLLDPTAYVAGGMAGIGKHFIEKGFENELKVALKDGARVFAKEAFSPRDIARDIAIDKIQDATGDNGERVESSDRYSGSYTGIPLASRNSSANRSPSQQYSSARVRFGSRFGPKNRYDEALSTPLVDNEHINSDSDDRGDDANTRRSRTDASTPSAVAAAQTANTAALHTLTAATSGLSGFLKNGVSGNKNVHAGASVAKGLFGVLSKIPGIGIGADAADLIGSGLGLFDGEGDVPGGPAPGKDKNLTVLRTSSDERLHIYRPQPGPMKEPMRAPSVNEVRQPGSASGGSGGWDGRLHPADIAAIGRAVAAMPPPQVNVDRNSMFDGNQQAAFKANAHSIG